MTMNLNTSIGQYEAPAAEFGGIAPRRESRHPPQQEKMANDDLVQHTQQFNGTAGQTDEIGLEWTINTSGSGRESKAAREILDKIDAATLRAAQTKGEGIKRQIVENRDRMAALLGQCDKWEQPDEVYADEAWEICIIWRSRYGMVEFGAEEDGRIGYFIKRTLNEQSEEGFFEYGSKDEIRRVMSWLEKTMEDN